MIGQIISHYNILENLGCERMGVGESTEGEQNAQTTF